MNKGHSKWYGGLLVVMLCAFVAQTVFAQAVGTSIWAPPSASAPSGNASRSLDVSDLPQIKQSALGIDTANSLLLLPAGSGAYVNSGGVYIQKDSATNPDWVLNPVNAIQTNGRARANGVQSTSVIQSDVLKSTGGEKTVCAQLSTGKLKLCGVTLGPSIVFTATPNAITGTQNVTLYWNSPAAVSCVGTKFSTGFGDPITGSVIVSVSATTTFRVTCTDAAGQSRTRNATVTVSAVLPTASITATPATVTSGQQSVIAWDSTNATTCAAIPPSPTSFNTGGDSSGSQTFTLTNGGTAPGTVTFAVRCTSSLGDNADATVTVTVNPLSPVVSFTATPVN